MAEHIETQQTQWLYHRNGMPGERCPVADLCTFYSSELASIERASSSKQHPSSTKDRRHTGTYGGGDTNTAIFARQAIYRQCADRNRDNRQFATDGSDQ